jgi:PKD repeat protein
MAIVTLNTGLPTGAYTYYWEFGDGQTSTDEVPTHEYVYAGTYNLRVTITNVMGDTVVETTVIIDDPHGVDLPVAIFTADVQKGPAPLSVIFTDASTGDISGWEWYVDDALQASTQAFNHTFTTDGTYTVKLKVAGSGDSIAEMVVAVASTASWPPIITALSATKTTSITKTLTTTFSATIDGTPTEYLWDFGDGYTSDAASPGHQYSGSGTYTVSLTVTNEHGSTTSTMQVKVLYVSGMHRPEGDAYVGNVPIFFYVVDEVNHKILIYKSETEFLGEFGSQGVGNGQFLSPTGLAVSGGTNLLDRIEI